MKVNLSELAAYLNAEVIFGELSGEICGAAIDSRNVASGCLFFAMQGQKTDGHNFVIQAAKSGARAAVVEKDVEIKAEHFTVLKVKDSKLALQQTAKFARQSFHGNVVGVTGSNGKTTTKDLVACVLAEKYAVHKTYANFNNEIGLPLTILNAPEGTNILVLEMGMRAKGEIAQLADIAKPNIGIITNIGVAHMELLKTQENIADAKFELISSLPDKGVAILNADDNWCVKKAHALKHVLFYGFTEKSHLRCLEMKLTEEGTYFNVAYENKNCTAFLPTWGRHNISNALAAIAVGLSCGMTLENAVAGLRKYQPSPMRLEVKNAKNGCKILDDVYNANPISMAASLEVLKEITSGRTIAVLGEMYELGPLEKTGHYEVGRKAAEKNISILVTVGQKAEEIAKGALENGMSEEKIFCFPDNEKAIEFLKIHLKREDTVLVKGSRGMHMEKIVEALI